ncbi:hypothetical protein [Methylococcus geothermalis]|uniref:Uncharacterized protein n=1 Tax=Methylococcus geothermalis TaxID=2681310 RepID=A0A858Q6W2_9GAMM|nr:hypothetical protein [Methylococcus geothermalis]QJD29579.1 hypothetical protein GNH96_06075 [Methylococcus geothermalis]
MSETPRRRRPHFRAHPHHHIHTETEARDWAARVEARLRRSSPKQVAAYNIRTMHEPFERYRYEIAPTERGQRFEVIRLDASCRGSLAEFDPVTLDAGHIRA